MAGERQAGAEPSCVRTTRVVVALTLLAALGSGAPARADPVRYRDAIFGSAAVAPNMQYGTALDSSGNPVALLLDIYLPNGDNDTSRAAIVFAHGGGFTGGDRSDASITTLADAFARHGFVTVSIDYRTRLPGSPGTTMQDLIVGSLAGQPPAAMHDAQHDMQAAVRWMRANALTWGIDADRIIAGGVSAGASMALETAFSPDDPGSSGNPGYDSEVQGALSISGATDPRRIEPGAPPVMLFNGTNDTTAPYPTAALACAATTVMLNVCELQTYVGAGHNLDQFSDEIVDLGADFLCRRVLGGCA